MMACEEVLGTNVDGSFLAAKLRVLNSGTSLCFQWRYKCYKRPNNMASSLHGV